MSHLGYHQVTEDLTHSLLNQSDEEAAVMNEKYPERRRWNGSIRQRIGAVLCALLIGLTPTPILRLFGHAASKPKPIGPTSYLDGIRGIAAFFVFIEHFALPYQPGMIGFGLLQGYSIFQLPIIRLFWSGSYAVTVFFVVSGFAISLKPLNMLYKKGSEYALEAVVSSVFRRGIRIFLPPIISVAITFIGIRLHMFDTVHVLTPPEYYDLTGPHFLPTFWDQLKDVSQFVVQELIYPNTWMQPLVDAPPLPYGSQLWTIPTEFWASMLLFICMTGLIKSRRIVRLVAIQCFIFYCAWCGRWDVGIFLYGMFLADIDVKKTDSALLSRRFKLIQHFLSIALFITGLWFGGFPDFYAPATPGYYFLNLVNSRRRFWQSLGAVLMIAAVNRSTWIQAIFTTRLAQYLGHISYALYLVHIPILDSYGYSLVPKLWSMIGMDTDLKYEGCVVLAFVILCPITIWVADVFWRAIDIPCTELARTIERKLSSDGESDGLAPMM